MDQPNYTLGRGELYFDKFKPNVAYVNVQHPDSGVDRTLMISTPCPQAKYDHDDDHGRDRDHNRD